MDLAYLLYYSLFWETPKTSEPLVLHSRPQGGFLSSGSRSEEGTPPFFNKNRSVFRGCHVQRGFCLYLARQGYSYAGPSVVHRAGTPQSTINLVVKE